MKPYDEALCVWASHRFGIPLDEIAAVRVEEVPAADVLDTPPGVSPAPACVFVTIWPKTENDQWWSHPQQIEDPLIAVAYEVVHAGMEER